jgi:hypothetical protein
MSITIHCQWPGHTCPREAETQITLEGGSTDPHVWKFCYDHYLEAHVIAEMLRRLTGMPEVREERARGTHSR